jgi:xanthine/uracil permease
VILAVSLSMGLGVTFSPESLHSFLKWFKRSLNLVLQQDLCVRWY